MKRSLFIIYILVLSATMLFSQGKENPKLSNPYLGQTPPGMTPEIFAPGLISQGFHEHGLSISPNGKEIYFASSHPVKMKDELNVLSRIWNVILGRCQSN